MKIIAFYLPQFHNIPENDEWWGDGFTEWVNVKAAKPLFEGHQQPKVPLNDNYYNLLDDNVKIWQAKIAKEHGVYGFCYYHYWFSGKMLLEKPMEQMLKNKAVDIPFCISWANETWTKAWVNDEKKVLILQKYGEKDEWKQHFDYLLPFFKDDRYIKENNKPLFIIYRPEVVECLNEMLDYWNQLAIENGFDGMCFAYQTINMDITNGSDTSRFDYDIEFQPSYARFDMSNQKSKLAVLKKIRRNVAKWFEKKFGIDLLRYTSPMMARKLLHTNGIDYSEAWETILARKPISNKCIPGAFAAWDNTPRHKERGWVYTNNTPEIFEKYLEKQIVRARDVYHKDMIFMYAWNEWAEGGYLEPDEEHGYAYLDAIRTALEKTGEFPEW
ncbi:glycoside hydrolase family 99-like domain-containing protein [Lachnoclostridium sp. Marseille-P6806]|jgi:hypothetical protein|uniref:glycosyltransferase WbsX family protein n=1 Tax=Lachnoclostridium sp. Marseille-P6806 TaxID=2364793 RepID=UPI0035627FBC